MAAASSGAANAGTGHTIVDHDVLVIGAGGAGLRAAIEASAQEIGRASCRERVCQYV